MEFYQGAAKAISAAFEIQFLLIAEIKNFNKISSLGQKLKHQQQFTVGQTVQPECQTNK